MIIYSYIQHVEVSELQSLYHAIIQPLAIFSTDTAIRTWFMTSDGARRKLDLVSFFIGSSAAVRVLLRR